jgi:hypothetical protein
LLYEHDDASIRSSNPLCFEITLHKTGNHLKAGTKVKQKVNVEFDKNSSK